MDKRTAIHTMNNHLMVILGNLELLGAELTDPVLQTSVDDAMKAAEQAIELMVELREAD